MDVPLRRRPRCRLRLWDRGAPLAAATRRACVRHPESGQRRRAESGTSLPSVRTRVRGIAAAGGIDRRCRNQRWGRCHPHDGRLQRRNAAQEDHLPAGALLAGAGAGIVGAGIGGPMADFFNALKPGLGYLVIFAIYGALFLISVATLTKVHIPASRAHIEI